MILPGFAAEASLYKTRGIYLNKGGFDLGNARSSAVVPAQSVCEQRSTNLCPAYRSCCANQGRGYVGHYCCRQYMRLCVDECGWAPIPYTLIL
jgi:hypothetical protein